MITVKVCRGTSFSGECREDDPSLNWGEDISDNLLTTEEAAIDRGTQEIDEVYTNRKDINVKTFETNFIQPGTLIGIVDMDEQKNGILQGVSINIARSVDSFTAESILSIEGNV